jgi:hypothetical protein
MSKETYYDLLNEKAIATIVEAHFKLKLEKIPEKYFPLDYQLINYKQEIEGLITGYCEIKARTIRSDKYSEMFIDLFKWHNLKSWSLVLPVYILYGWTDCIGIKRVELKDRYPIKKGGTADRKQPSVFIPVSEFKMINEDYREFVKRN